MAAKRTQILHPDRPRESQPAPVTTTTVTLTEASRKKDVLNYLMMAILLGALAYTAFTIGSMVPDARRHFVDTFLNPQLRHFLAP